MVVKGEWKRTRGDFESIIGDGKLVATIPWTDAESDANLIVTAVNACKAINPGNPIAVAKKIEAMFTNLYQEYGVLEGAAAVGNLKDWDQKKLDILAKLLSDMAVQ